MPALVVQAVREAGLLRRQRVPLIQSFSHLHITIGDAKSCAWQRQAISQNPVRPHILNMSLSPEIIRFYEV